MPTSAADHGWCKDDLEPDDGVATVFKIAQRDIVVCALESLKIRKIDCAPTQKFGILDLSQGSLIRDDSQNRFRHT